LANSNIILYQSYDVPFIQSCDCIKPKCLFVFRFMCGGWSGKYEVFRKTLFLEKCASCFGNRQKLCVASTFPSRDSAWHFGELPKSHLYENCFVGGGMRQSQRAHRNPAQNYPLVWDKENAEIVRLYVEEELGFNKIAEILGRSSRTALTQIRKHSRAVERSGFCPACRRLKSKYECQTTAREQSYCS